MTGLAGALRFLTRVPIPGHSDVPHHRSVPWFPAAGTLIGAAVGGTAALAAEWLSPVPAAALAIAVGLLVTGAFHEDGLADCADAFGGGWDREQRLGILKDSRHGTYGVAALCTSIVVRVAALGGVPGQAAMFAVAVTAHVLARAAAVAVLAWAPPAAPAAQGLGVSARSSLRATPVVLALAGALGVAAAAVGWWAAPALAAATAAAAATTTLSVRKIGGVVGDSLGAVEQVAECLVLVVLAGLASHHAVWWA